MKIKDIPHLPTVVESIYDLDMLNFLSDELPEELFFRHTDFVVGLNDVVSWEMKVHAQHLWEYGEYGCQLVSFWDDGKPLFVSWIDIGTTSDTYMLDVEGFLKFTDKLRALFPEKQNYTLDEDFDLEDPFFVGGMHLSKTEATWGE